MPRRNCTAPPALLALATLGSQLGTGLAPARSWRLAPAGATSQTRTEETVTVRPMSTSRPVPVLRLEKNGVAYHWLYQGAARLPATARAAICGLSPLAVPDGPNAVTRVTVSACAGTGAAVGDAEADEEAEAEGDELAMADDRTALALPGRPGPAAEGRELAAAAGRALPTPEANL